MARQTCTRPAHVVPRILRAADDLLSRQRFLAALTAPQAALPKPTVPPPGWATRELLDELHRRAREDVAALSIPINSPGCDRAHQPGALSLINERARNG